MTQCYVFAEQVPFLWREKSAGYLNIPSYAPFNLNNAVDNSQVSAGEKDWFKIRKPCLGRLNLTSLCSVQALE